MFHAHDCIPNEFRYPLSAKFAAWAAASDGVTGIIHADRGDIAQLGERFNGIEEVMGSSPIISTKSAFFSDHALWCGRFGFWVTSATFHPRIAQRKRVG